MASASAKIKKYLQVEKHHIYAKVQASITFDLSEYKDITENYGEEVGIAEIENVYEVPGFFTIEFPEENDSIDFFLPYNIYVQKTEDTYKDKDKITIEFKPQDLIFYANVKEEETNISILSNLFQNGVKYLGNKPDKLLTAIWQQLLPQSNIPWQHLEVIVSQLYGSYDSKTKEIKPLRLTGLPYSKKYILNLKESAHQLNQTLPIMYGYANDALRTMVSKKKRGENSFFENIISGDYDKLTEKYTKEK
jgi:hypothetical protein